MDHIPATTTGASGGGGAAAQARRWRPVVAAACALALAVLAAAPAWGVSAGAWVPLDAEDQSGAQPDKLRDLSCPAAGGGDVCVAVGENGEVFRTVDGGETWTSPRAGTTARLNGVDCPTGGTCYAVGSGGAIIKTVDGGASWTSQSSGTSEDLNAASCADADHCHAVGDAGTILATTDGGANWGSQTSGTSEHLHGIDCPTTEICYAVGEKVLVLKTTDGGTTKWATVHGPADFSGTHNAVSCPETDTCYVVGSQPERATMPLVRHSFDGGSNWHAHAVAGIRSLRDVDCPTASVCVAGGTNGLTVATGTGGEPARQDVWAHQASGRDEDLLGVSCPDTQTCFAAGSGATDGILLRSVQANAGPVL